MPVQAAPGRRKRNLLPFFCLGLLLGKNSGESNGGIEEALANVVVAVGFGGGTDIAVHAATAHDNRDNTGKGERPSFVVRPNAEHETPMTGSTQ